jgi:hypothetical protein
MEIDLNLIYAVRSLDLGREGCGYDVEAVRHTAPAVAHVSDISEAEELARFVCSNGGNVVAWVDPVVVDDGDMIAALKRRLLERKARLKALRRPAELFATAA